MACLHLTAQQVIAATPGLSYRQLHFWTTAGLVRGAHKHSRIAVAERAAEPLPADWGSSGTPLYYPEDICDELAAVVAIMQGGRLEQAFALAQGQAVALGKGRHLAVMPRTAVTGEEITPDSPR
jgi:hypothetical protein